MEPENRALVLDFVEWVSDGPRPYKEVMDIWGTSCPRLTVWEDTLDHGYVARSRDGAGVARVAVTEKGKSLLRDAGRLRTVSAAAPRNPGDRKRGAHA